jgi:DNA-binding beta-propeller fold protein YncE
MKCYNSLTLVICQSCSSQVNVLVDFQAMNLVDPRGLAVDWVGKRIYWVDAGQDVVMVSDLTGEKKCTLIDTDLDQPHDIVVDPQSG